MAKILHLIFLLIILAFAAFCPQLQATDSSTAWTKLYGFSGPPISTAIVQISDGGYVIAGTNQSDLPYGDPNAANPPASVWLIKVDSLGNREWTKIISVPSGITYRPAALIATSDNGFALLATSGSGDDSLFIKTDSSGNTQFTKTFGIDTRRAYHPLIQTSGGGYALVGGWNDNKDGLIKIDGQGNLLWNKSYSPLYAYSDPSAIVQTDDGGFAIVGKISGAEKDSQGHFVTMSQGWLCKVDASGVLQWQTSYLGAFPTFKSIVVSADGGYTIGGTLVGTVANNSLPEAANSFALMVKTDSVGTLQWSKVYMGSYSYSVVGSGSSYSLLKTDTNVIMWNQTYSEVGGDMEANCLIKTNDGGYALIGKITTLRSDPAWGLGEPYSSSDFWLIKTDASGTMQWNQAYGSVSRNEEAKSGIQTSDGGFALTGSLGYYFAIWVVKTNTQGITVEATTTSTPQPTATTSSQGPLGQTAQPTSVPTSTHSQTPTPTPIPEFSPLVIIPILIGLLLVAVVAKMKMGSQKPSFRKEA
jgi:hypothetical protein